MIYIKNRWCVCFHVYSIFLASPSCILDRPTHLQRDIIGIAFILGILILLVFLNALFMFSNLHLWPHAVRSGVNVNKVVQYRGHTETQTMTSGKQREHSNIMRPYVRAGTHNPNKRQPGSRHATHTYIDLDHAVDSQVEERVPQYGDVRDDRQQVAHVHLVPGS